MVSLINELSFSHEAMITLCLVSQGKLGSSMAEIGMQYLLILFTQNPRSKVCYLG